ncbi:MAG: phosphatase [Burkholderiaceae bacterium]|nr:phosphatase [Burkholderiaceae bacterium]
MIRAPVAAPLRIDSLAVPGSSARLGITCCPGTHRASAAGGARAHDLEADLARIAAWGSALLLTLMEQHELARHGVPDLGARARRSMTWCWLPIVDRQAPDAAFEAAWPQAIEEVQRRLDAGDNVVLHCLGGLGRSGMIAARILVERGLAPAAAMAVVRAARPGAIETAQQEAYVLGLRRATAAAVLPGRKPQ